MIRHETLTSARIPSLFRPALPAVLAAAAALLVALPAAGSSSRGAVLWNAPTHADHFRAVVDTGAHVTLRLRAATTIPGATVSIVATRALPRPTPSYRPVSGKSATARVDWVPTAGGDYTIGFAASAGHVSAPSRTYTIHVVAKPYGLTNAKVAHWAPVLKPASRVRPEPTRARRRDQLETTTSDTTQNIVLVLDGST